MEGDREGRGFTARCHGAALVIALIVGVQMAKNWALQCVWACHEGMRAALSVRRQKGKEKKRGEQHSGFPAGPPR
jgi:hypothetical protein